MSTVWTENGEDTVKDDLDTVRGIVWGILLSIPLWAGLAYLYWWAR